MVAVLLLLQLGGPDRLRRPARLQSVVIHVRLNQPLEELDGLDTDQGMGDETLEFEAGKVMAQEIAGPLGLGRAQ